jgi:hypothetical protein
MSVTSAATTNCSISGGRCAVIQSALTHLARRRVGVLDGLELGRTEAVTEVGGTVGVIPSTRVRSRCICLVISLAFLDLGCRDRLGLAGTDVGPARPEDEPGRRRRQAVKRRRG